MAKSGYRKICPIKRTGAKRRPCIAAKPSILFGFSRFSLRGSGCGNLPRRGCGRLPRYKFCHGANPNILIFLKKGKFTYPPSTFPFSPQKFCFLPIISHHFHPVPGPFLSHSFPILPHAFLVSQELFNEI